MKLYWSGWEYIVYKLLAYRYLNILNQLGRYVNLYLKVVEPRNHISTQVQGYSISCMYFGFKYSCLYI
jgi:hypothetical protein